LALRVAARRWGALALALGLAIAVVRDAEAPLEPAWLWVFGAVWLVLFVWRCAASLRAETRNARTELEISALLVVATYGALGRSDGGLSGPLYPLVYVLVAAVSAFARPLVAALSLAVLVALEGSIRYAALAERTLLPLSLHAGFIAIFAVMNLVFLRAEIARIRVRARAHLEAEFARMRDAARSYRLLGAPRGAAELGPARPGDDDKLARSSVEEIHQAVLFALELLRQSLGLHTALLLWQSEAGTHARISELSTDADNVSEGPFLSGDGIIGAVLVRRASVVLDGLKPGYKLPYYAGPCPVRAVCGVPVMDHESPRGVLLVDRTDDRPFSPRDEEMLVSATRYVARAIQNERVFVQLERAKVEQGKLYRAAEALGAATTEGTVVEAGVKSARGGSLRLRGGHAVR
jgi:GAF domain-containing protein